MTEPASRGVALAFMKRAARDTFELCAQSAFSLAEQIERGKLKTDTVSTLRMLAVSFRQAGRTP